MVNLFKKTRIQTLEEIRLEELKSQVKNLSAPNKKLLYKDLSSILGRRCHSCDGRGSYKTTIATSSNEIGDTVRCFGCYGVGYRVELWDES